MALGIPREVISDKIILGPEVSTSITANMEASGPSTPWDGKFFASDALDDGPETQVRPTRLAFHEDPAVCEFMLGTVTAAVPLKIAASKLASPGSGLFVMKDVENGQELFSSQTPFVCFDPEEMGICHYCLSHMGSPVYTGKACVSSGQDSSLVIRACTGCNFARFCSKVSRSPSLVEGVLGM